MKYKILVILCLLFAIKTSGQTEKNQYIGINMFQLPSSTINLNYSLELKSFLTIFIDGGYTLNYMKVYSADIRYLMSSPPTPGSGRPIYIGGEYIKLGGYLNFRKSFEKKHFFRFGLFFNNSIVTEKKDFYDSYYYPYHEIHSHSLYIYGISILAGYEFTIFKRLKSSIDCQLSFPSWNRNYLYSYFKFIPGMGFNETSNWQEVFPMLLWNIKYKL